MKDKTREYRVNYDKEGKMKKLICFVLVLFLFSHCGTKQEKVEKIREDRIEVVINHIEPYKIRTTSSTFVLLKEREIDTESKDLAEIGLTEIGDFDVDSKGNLYIVTVKSDENLIFKFDAKGNYLFSFCRKGQGPGEVPSVSSIRINHEDKVIVNGNMKFLFFALDGTLLREVKTDFYFYEGEYLDNGNFLIKTGSRPSEKDSKIMERDLVLYDTQFNKIKILDKIKHENILARKVKGTFHNLVSEVNAGKIFTGNQERGYEILIFDFEGNLIRKIRKEYKKVSSSDGYKEKFTRLFKKDPQIYAYVKNKIYFPSSLPPFHYFITDDRGRIYVMTYEKGENLGEYIFDIFNEEGAFIGRKSLKDFSFSEGLNGKIKYNHLYFIEEKKSGFQKLVAYKVIWK